MIWFLSLLIGFTIQSNNRHFIIPEKDIHYVNQFFPDSILDYRIDRAKNRIYITASEIPIAVFPDRQNGIFNTWVPRVDSVIEIWLPDSTGGVLYPEEFCSNPFNNKIYVIGGRGRSVAVCDADSGIRFRSIQTGKGTIALAYNMINNKVYCANFYDSTVSVIEGETDTIIKNISFGSEPYDLVWNNANNTIYCANPYENKVTVIDGVTNTIITEISIGNYPFLLLFNPLSNKVYCTSQTNVSIIDCNSNNVITSIPVNFGFLLGLNSTDNKVYCVSSYDDNVLIIDGVGDTLITTVSLGNLPECIEYNSVMNLIYIGEDSNREIYVIDGSTNQIITTINIGEWFNSLAYDSLDNRLFVATNNYHVIAIDCSTNGIEDYLPTGHLSKGIFWEGKFNQVWIANTGASNVPGYTLDGYSGDLLQYQFRTPVGFPSYSSAFNSSDNKLYTGTCAENYISILNLNSPEIANIKEVRDGPRDIIYNSIVNKIYCANRLSSTVSVIDGATDSTIAEIATGQFPVSLKLNRTDNKIYSTNSADSSVSVINGSSNNIIKNIAVPCLPYAMLWNAMDSKIYVGTNWEGIVSIINSNSDSLITTVNVGMWPWSFTHNTINDKVYCANYASDNITVIDGVTDQVLSTISLSTDAYPLTLAYNSTNNKVYSANIFGESISIINAEADSVITTIQVSGFPYSLLYNPIDNAVYCAYVNNTYGLWQDAIVIIDGETNNIIDSFVLDSDVKGGGVDSPQKALVLDSLQNIIYLCHNQTSKISRIEGLVQGVEKSYDSPTKSPSLHMFPNPFSSYLWIKCSQEKCGKIRARIYDISGRLVKTLAAYDEYPNALVWDGKDKNGAEVNGGIYFLKLNGKPVGKVVKVR